MKAIKYLVAGALMLSIAAPTMAQDVKSQVDAITKVVVDAKGDVNLTKSQVKDFMKANKKNPEALAGLGRAFLAAKNFDQAKFYADMAMKVGKNSSAGYILRGDIASAEDNGGEAASYYEMSTVQAPQDPLAYVKYARVYQKVDAQGAVAMLEKLRAVKPDYPVDAAAGFMYSQNGQLKSAISYYDKVADPKSIEDYILFDYASTAYVLDDFAKALNLANVGIAQYPQYSSFNRIALYSSDKLKQYDQAVSYGEKLFSATDTIKYTANDYIYYADALLNTGKCDEAIASYKHITEVEPDNKLVNKYVALAYKKAKKYPEAVASMEEYIKGLGSDVTSQDYESLVDVYVTQGLEEGASEQQKVKALENADKVYASMSDKFENAASYVAWKRAGINHTINPNVKEGRALPYYKEFISLVEPKADKTKGELNSLATAYTYLAVYYIQNDKKAEAKEFASKVLEIRPDDQNAQAIVKACK